MCFREHLSCGLTGEICSRSDLSRIFVSASLLLLVFLAKCEANEGLDGSSMFHRTISYQSRHAAISSLR